MQILRRNKSKARKCNNTNPKLLQNVYNVQSLLPPLCLICSELSG
jgi:hypothetical protein